MGHAAQFRSGACPTDRPLICLRGRQWIIKVASWWGPIQRLATYERLQAMRFADLETLVALGMSEADGKVLLSAPVDEARDHKLVFVSTAAASGRDNDDR
jgi:hypothetical protein